ncbi:MAG: phenylacetate--CoA ligase family protein [Candidatus Omnitrophica bacterium]|nr:phenylacetate--CoA ligase family protein [Candidatus Omnitrophota bacterium]
MKEIWSKFETYDWRCLEEEVAEPLFKKQIKYVLENSRFYHEKFRKISVVSLEDLEKLPFTTKQEILDDEKRYPPFGSNLSGKITNIQRVHKTSGTSTEPLILAFSNNDLEHTLECGARCFWSAGVRPRDMIVHCLNYCMWAGGLTDHESLEKAGAAVIPYGVGNSSNLIQTILTIKPTGIHCTPSYLSKLEDLLRLEFSIAPSKLGLKIGLFGGEGGLENDDFRENIEKRWGLRAMNANYGMSDVLSMFASECRERAGLHFMGQGVIHAQICDESSQKTIPWDVGARGELVLTNLCKEMQPLVRYKTCDIVEVIGMGLCSCGRMSPRFRVVGRREDMIVVKGVNVFLSSVADIINQRLDILTGDFRVQVDRNDPIEHFVICLEAKTDKINQIVIHELENLFKHKLGLRPEMRFLKAGVFPKTEGKTRRLERVL